ncbi:MAG: dihydrofolate reductase family protein [Oligoflexales bacterium]|nr:dihydrofolate reductase family protein [Oligoflexales bacterium]
MYLLNVMAVSIDGKISAHAGESDGERMQSGFINEDDHNLVEHELKQADAVIIGADTLRASGRIWALKNHQNVFPPWYVFTSKGFDSNLPFWKQNAIERVLVTPKPFSREEHWHESIKSIAYEDHSPATFVYNHLKGRNIEKIILFGGGHVNTMFYQEGLVDALQLTIAPMIIGKKYSSSFISPHLSESIDLKLESSQVSKNHVFLRYTVKKP